MSTSSPSRVVCLDFDGVLCDSEPALTKTAWRAACKRWPDVMQATVTVDPKMAGARRAWTGGSWEPLQGTSEEGMPNWLREKMRLCVPLLSSGYESTLIMRLCADEALSAAPGKRPLTIGELGSNWGPDMRDTLLARYAFRSREEAVELYETARDQWYAEDPDTWLDAAGTFYDGAIGAVREVMADDTSSATSVYVLTSKSHEAARALLSASGLELDDEHVLSGIQGDAAKAARLAELRQQHAEATLAFVDDSVPPLRAVANHLGLFGAELYHARWGYSTPQQQAEAAAMPRVRGLGPESADLVTVLRDGEA